MLGLAIGQAAGGVLGGILGNAAQQSGIQEAGDAQKAAISGIIAKLDEAGLPPDLSNPVVLNEFKVAGLLNPQLEQQIAQVKSEFDKIKTDQGLRSQQLDALRRMSQYGQAGLTADERAQSRQLQNDVQRQNEANQQAIIQNMAARGQGGGGAELAARLQASQGSANQASESADRISSLAAQRALQAIGSQAGLASQLRQQDYSEEANRAQAQDVMNRFSTENQIGIGQRNVASQNQAQQYNLANKQDVSNKNVGQSNAELYRQLEAKRQHWQDMMQRAGAYGNALGQYGNAAATQAKESGQAQSNMWGGLFGGLASNASNIYGAASGADWKDIYGKNNSEKKKES